MGLDVKCVCGRDLEIEVGNSFGPTLIVGRCQDCIQTARDEENQELAGLGSEYNDLEKKYEDLVAAMKLLIQKYEPKLTDSKGGSNVTTTV